MNNFFYIYKLAIVTFILRLPDINSNCDFFLRIVSYKLAIASYKVQFWGENILAFSQNCEFIYNLTYELWGKKTPITFLFFA